MLAGGGTTMSSVDVITGGMMQRQGAISPRTKGGVGRLIGYLPFFFFFLHSAMSAMSAIRALSEIDELALNPFVMVATPDGANAGIGETKQKLLAPSLVFPRSALSGRSCTGEVHGRSLMRSVPWGGRTRTGRLYFCDRRQAG